MWKGIMRNIAEDKIRKEYLEWLYDITYNSKNNLRKTYKKLFECLYDTEYRYSIFMDKNRAANGKELRTRHCYEMKSYINASNEEKEAFLSAPCSVLEMMVALAVKIEEQIMSDDDYGNRTGKWFYRMLENLEIIDFDDKHFKELYVDAIVNNFLDGNIFRNGKGGIFRTTNPNVDMRNMELWYQMNEELENENAY